MALADTYTAYLRRDAGRDDMADVLAAAGHELEASLLSGDKPGWVGPGLPAAAEQGDLWLDTVELMPMVFFARADSEPFGWLALRPVERWQFAGFLDLTWAGALRRRIGEVKPFERGRLLAGAETDPVTHLLHDEAESYAMWFGKAIPSRATWQLAAEVLDTDALWGPVREWADAEYDGAYLVVDAELIDFDSDSDEEWPSLVLDGSAAPDGVGFRTFVRAQSGLYTETWASETYGLTVGKPAKR